MPASTRTQVAVVGAGPAGLTVANLLRAKGVESMEEWAVPALERHGLADRLLRTAETQDSFEFRFDGARHIVRYGELSGRRHFVYPSVISHLAACPEMGRSSPKTLETRDETSVP